MKAFTYASLKAKFSCRVLAHALHTQCCMWYPAKWKGRASLILKIREGGLYPESLSRASHVGDNYVFWGRVFSSAGVPFVFACLMAAKHCFGGVLGHINLF